MTSFYNYRFLSLRFVLVVPFLIQITAAVGVVSYISFRNGQKTVEDLARQLMQETNKRIEQHLNGYLEKPYIVNQNVLGAVALGYLNSQKLSNMDQYFTKQMQLFGEVSYVDVGNEQGEFNGLQRLENGQLNFTVSNMEF